VVEGVQVDLSQLGTETKQARAVLGFDGGEDPRSEAGEKGAFQRRRTSPLLWAAGGELSRGAVEETSVGDGEIGLFGAGRYGQQEAGEVRIGGEEDEGDVEPGADAAGPVLLSFGGRADGGPEVLCDQGAGGQEALRFAGEVVIEGAAGEVGGGDDPRDRRLVITAAGTDRDRRGGESFALVLRHEGGREAVATAGQLGQKVARLVEEIGAHRQAAGTIAAERSRSGGRSGR
jgi:hypothetical protein